jgi:hypothetical protein
LDSEKAAYAQRKIEWFWRNQAQFNEGTFSLNRFAERDFVFEADSLIIDVIQNKSVDLMPHEMILNQTQCESAQCALVGGQIQENVQPSASIGQWLKFLLMANSPIPAGKFIVNEFGHFIPTAKLGENEYLWNA